MQPERRSSSSIPVVGMSVNKAITELMAGQAVCVHKIGVSFGVEATEPEYLDSIALLWSVDDQTKIRTHFSIGDGVRHGKARFGVRFMRALKKRFGVAVYNEFRRFAWVAGKWPIDKRTDESSWNFYLVEDPCKEKKVKRPKPPIKLRIIGKYIVDGEEVIHQVDDYGRQYVGQVEVLP